VHIKIIAKAVIFLTTELELLLNSASVPRLYKMRLGLSRIYCAGSTVDWTYAKFMNLWVTYCMCMR